MTQVKCIDPRHGPAVFASYAPLIAIALKAWPAVTSFPPPPNTALSTFVARWRDSLLGYRAHLWPTPYFTAEDFAKIDGQFVLRPDFDANLVHFDHRNRQGRKPLDQSPSAISSSSTSLASYGPFTPPLTPQELTAFLTLLNSGRLSGTLTLPPGPPDLTPYPALSILSSDSTSTIII